jgi:hypothetical protein
VPHRRSPCDIDAQLLWSGATGSSPVSPTRFAQEIISKGDEVGPQGRRLARVGTAHGDVEVAGLFAQSGHLGPPGAATHGGWAGPPGLSGSLLYVGRTIGDGSTNRSRNQD